MINVGKLCNLAAALLMWKQAQNRKEIMERDDGGLSAGLQVKQKVKTVDITGGAPEK